MSPFLRTRFLYIWLVLISALFRIASTLWVESPSLPSTSPLFIFLSSDLKSDLWNTPASTTSPLGVSRTSLQSDLWTLQTGSLVLDVVWSLKLSQYFRDIKSVKINRRSSPRRENAPNNSSPLVVQSLEAEVSLLTVWTGDQPDLAGPVAGVQHGVAIIVTRHLSPLSHHQTSVEQFVWKF